MTVCEIEGPQNPIPRGSKCTCENREFMEISARGRDLPVLCILNRTPRLSMKSRLRGTPDDSWKRTCPRCVTCHAD